MIDRVRRRERWRGQALAEFAIVVPVLMLILGGVIQFGMIFWGQNTLNQIVRDAGRYAVTEPNCSSGSNAEVVSKITTIASNTSLAATLGTVTVLMPTADTTDTCPPASNATHVWISIEVHAQVPVFFPFIPGNGNISSAARFRMEPVTP
jgi:Flp pilus assembly protein TadG